MNKLNCHMFPQPFGAPQQFANPQPFGAPEVACGVLTPACVRKKYPLPPERYEPLAGKPSFCEQKVEVAWASGKTSWPKTNAQGLQLESAAWQLLCFCNAKDKWDRLPFAWMSLLPPRGTLLRKKPKPKSVFIVLGLACVQSGGGRQRKNVKENCNRSCGSRIQRTRPPRPGCQYSRQKTLR